MQDKLKAFVKLAEIDASARHLEEQLEGIPVELEERRVAVEALEQLVHSQKREMDEAEALMTAQDEDLKLRSDMLSRSKAKGAKARNMREAEAAERELDAIRRSIKEGEAEKERLQGVIEQSRSILAEPLRELEEQKQNLAEAEAASEGRLAELRAERDVITAGRKEASGKIPKPIFRRYERLRTQIHPTLTEAKDGVCMGCRIQIAPQLYNQIIKGDDFYQCQACQRFLYHADVVAD
ncbi:MAG: hypothetical protein H6719_12690 [Sandaracinaceae bacterium]|nr:hypothetical protein [Sandaracinaceae bacterium]